jgi:hypothetical protein
MQIVIITMGDFAFKVYFVAVFDKASPVLDSFLLFLQILPPPIVFGCNVDFMPIQHLVGVLVDLSTIGSGLYPMFTFSIQPVL